MIKDPVCNMEVSSSQSLASSYEGRDYYFCSSECKRQFDRNPAHFAAQASGTSQEAAKFRR